MVTPGYVAVTSGHFWLLNRYYWLLLITSGYLWFLVLVTTINGPNY